MSATASAGDAHRGESSILARREFYHRHPARAVSSAESPLKDQLQQFLGSTQVRIDQIHPSIL